MSIKSIIKKVGGPLAVSKLCGVTRLTVHNWCVKNQLPDSAYSGKKPYADIIVKASNGQVTREELLKPLDSAVTEDGNT